MSTGSKQEDKNSDESLALLAVEDKNFFAYLVDRYEPLLRRYVFRITNATREDVEDILQDVFVKAYINLKSFDADLKFSSWIYRITYHEVISRYRKIKRRPEGNFFDLEDQDLSFVKDSLSLEKEFDNNLLGGLILKAFDGLDAKYKQVFYLRFMEGKTYEEISDIIKKPPGSVATLVHRARKKVQKRIKEDQAYE